MQPYIVIGAGILGASTAYHLAASGVPVTLIDRQDPGQATDAASGVICPWLSQRRNQVWYSLAKAGARYYPVLIKQLELEGEMDTGYKKVGAISLHTDDEKLTKIMERALKRREDAPEMGEIIRLTSSETHKLFPLLDESFSSIFVSGAARVNGRALCQALINAAKKNGAAFCVGDASIVFKDKLITGVKINDELIPANKVIDATGVWSQKLLKSLGVNFGVTSQKGQVIHLRMPNMDTSTWPVVMPPGDQGILAFDGGRIVIGATHENNRGLDTRATAGGLHEIFAKALSVAPGLADATVLETRVGFRPFTPGFLPVIGQVPSFSGLFIANGLGASGLTVGPYLGLELANLAMGLKTGIDIQKYDVGEAIE